jgi:glutamine synthetase
VPLDTRRILQLALGKLAQQGFGMVCGLEVEFHIYRIKDPHNGPDLDPVQAAWPGQPPTVSMIHPGYNLLAESWIDMAEEPLRIVQHTAQALGLPLQSLEIELGPSQVEAVFDATDALTAADNMVLFRNGVRQALRRAGYHASFMCRPPFPTSCPAAGTCINRWWTVPRAPTPSCATRPRPAPRRPTRCTR